MSTTLSALHDAVAWVVVVGNGLAGTWALAGVRWPVVRRPALWWLTGFAEVAVFVEAALGAGMVAGEGYPAPRFHMFYGFLAIFAVGIIYSYRQQLRDRLFLLYGLGGLFIMGLGVRAMQVSRA